MVLVAEHRHRDLDPALVPRVRRRCALLSALDRPAPVVVDPGALRRFRLVQRAAALDRVWRALASGLRHNKNAGT
jgi:hypothetical protein